MQGNARVHIKDVKPIKRISDREDSSEELEWESFYSPFTAQEQQSIQTRLTTIMSALSTDTDMKCLYQPDLPTDKVELNLIAQYMKYKIVSSKRGSLLYAQVKKSSDGTVVFGDRIPEMEALATKIFNHGIGATSICNGSSGLYHDAYQQAWRSDHALCKQLSTLALPHVDKVDVSNLLYVFNTQRKDAQMDAEQGNQLIEKISQRQAQNFNSFFHRPVRSLELVPCVEPFDTCIGDSYSPLNSTTLTDEIVPPGLRDVCTIRNLIFEYNLAAGKIASLVAFWNVSSQKVSTHYPYEYFECVIKECKVKLQLCSDKIHNFFEQNPQYLPLKNNRNAVPEERYRDPIPFSSSQTPEETALFKTWYSAYYSSEIPVDKRREYELEYRALMGDPAKGLENLMTGPLKMNGDTFDCFQMGTYSIRNELSPCTGEHDIPSDGSVFTEVVFVFKTI